MILIIIKVGNGGTTNVVCRLNKKTHLTVKFTDVFFIGYSLLLKIIANAIIKAIAMIVICIKVKNNMYITVIKYDASIISLTSFWRQTTSAYLLISYGIQYITH